MKLKVLFWVSPVFVGSAMAAAQNGDGITALIGALLGGLSFGGWAGYNVHSLVNSSDNTFREKNNG